MEEVVFTVSMGLSKTDCISESRYQCISELIILLANFICRKLDNLFKKYKYVFLFIASWGTQVTL